jgi:hypothetical protein
MRTAVTDEQPGNRKRKPLDSLVELVFENARDRGRRRKGPGFTVVTNPQNPPAPWNDMTAELKLILSPAVRLRLGLLKPGRKSESNAA